MFQGAKRDMFSKCEVTVNDKLPIVLPFLCIAVSMCQSPIGQVTDTAYSCQICGSKK